MDDVLTFGRNRTEHDARLTTVLERLETAGVTLNAYKCEFSKSQLIFLGHLVDQDGVRPDPARGSI